jgi:hypothetical protein
VQREITHQQSVGWYGIKQLTNHLGLCLSQQSFKPNIGIQ